MNREKLVAERDSLLDDLNQVAEHIATVEVRGSGSDSALSMIDTLRRRGEGLEARIREINSELGVQQRSRPSIATPRSTHRGNDDGPRRIHFDEPREEADGRTGVLTRGQRVSDWQADRQHPCGFTVADAEEFNIGSIMRAMVEPRFRSELTDVEARALAEGVDATGGFITPEPLSANFIDKVRNQAQVFAAGAGTVPLDSDRQSIPRLSGDPTFGWRTENSPFDESQPAFERVTFTPQSGGFIVRTSEELYQDMVPGGNSVIENSIVQTAALELDRVALRGSGVAPEPAGIRFQDGVTLQSLGVDGATPSDYGDLMTAVTTLLTANRQPTGILLAPRTSQTYAGLVDSTGQPLNAPQPVAALPRFVTAQVPTDITQGANTDTSEIYVGHWPDLLVGIRLGIQLRLLTERFADNGQYAWRVFLRADVQLAHPESFVVITGARG